MIRLLLRWYSETSRLTRFWILGHLLFVVVAVAGLTLALDERSLELLMLPFSTVSPVCVGWHFYDYLADEDRPHSFRIHLYHVLGTAIFVFGVYFLYLDWPGFPQRFLMSSMAATMFPYLLARIHVERARTGPRDE